MKGSEYFLKPRYVLEENVFENTLVCGVATKVNIFSSATSPIASRECGAHAGFFLMNTVVYFARGRE